MVVMAVGPTGTGKSSLLNALLCPAFRTNTFDDCHFKTGTGPNSVTRQVEWWEGPWLNNTGQHTATVVAYDTPGLGDSHGDDYETLQAIAETIEAKEKGPIPPLFHCTLA